MTSRARTQTGSTLIEVMLVVSISAVLLMPLMAWMIMGIRIGGQIETTSSEVKARNLVSAYLTRDVVGAAAAERGGADCAGGLGAGGTVLLRLSTAGGSPISTVYTVTPLASGNGRVWRRVCPPGGAPTSVTEVVEEAVTPTIGWATTVTCADRPGRSGEGCGRIGLTFATPEGGTVQAVATRRIGGPQ